MQQLTDHLGRQVTIAMTPKRIISICPAITETLFSLGLENNIIGRTKYCIFPKEKVGNVTIVGGTKDVDVDKIRQLQPDLILAEKEENTVEIVQALEKIAPVFVLEVQSIEHAYRFIQTLGLLTNKVEIAEHLVNSCKNGFQSLPHQQRGNAAYVIWRKPYMVVGNTTYINDVLKKMGFHNPFEAASTRYPTATKEQLVEVNLNVLLLASEPFPFQEKHIAEFQAFLPNTKILLVDGEMFWYGVKMIEAKDYFAELLERV